MDPAKQFAPEFQKHALLMFVAQDLRMGVYLRAAGKLRISCPVATSQSIAE
jgi:hypothetical protein